MKTDKTSWTYSKCVPSCNVRQQKVMKLKLRFLEEGETGLRERGIQSRVADTGLMVGFG